MSHTSFCPESPTARVTRLLGEALLAEVNLHPTEWPRASREVAIDCVKWLGGEVESEKCKRDNNGVRFVHLTSKQSDTLHFLHFSVMMDVT